MGSMSAETTDPFNKTDSDYQRRLINFGTGKFDLLPGHKEWLDSLLRDTPATREFECHIYAFASKLGSTESNSTLAFNRATAVAKYLEDRDPKYSTRISMFKVAGELDPSYVARESDNDPRWRAVEIHLKIGRPPAVKPGATKINRPAKTHMKWSVSGYFSLMASIANSAQFGISLYKFRNDETGEVRKYLSPMAGAGVSFDVLRFLKWIKDIGNRKLPGWAHLDHLAESILKNPSLLSNPNAVLKEIGKAILTGSGVQDWTDFSRCDVNLPLSFNILDGKTIGNNSGTIGLYQLQKVYVYGQVWYVEKSGKKMFGTKDLLSASSSGWVAQVPALALGAVGGPLLLL